MENFMLGNLTVRAQGFVPDEKELQETNRFLREFAILAEYHTGTAVERIRRNMLTEKNVAVIHLDQEHSLLVLADPELKNCLRFFDYNRLTGDVSDEMDYRHFRKMNDYGNMAFFESRMDFLHELDMSQMLMEGTMERIYALIDEKEEEYEIGD